MVQLKKEIATLTSKMKQMQIHVTFAYKNQYEAKYFAYVMNMFVACVFYWGHRLVRTVLSGNAMVRLGICIMFRVFYNWK